MIGGRDDIGLIHSVRVVILGGLLLVDIVHSKKQIGSSGVSHQSLQDPAKFHYALMTWKGVLGGHQQSSKPSAAAFAGVPLA